MHPTGKTKSHFLGNFCWASEVWTLEGGGVVNLAVLACVLRTTTYKIKVINFFINKCTPEKILDTPMS